MIACIIKTAGNLIKVEGTRLVFDSVVPGSRTKEKIRNIIRTKETIKKNVQ